MEALYKWTRTIYSQFFARTMFVNKWDKVVMDEFRCIPYVYNARLDSWENMSGVYPAPYLAKMQRAGRLEWKEGPEYSEWIQKIRNAK